MSLSRVIILVFLSLLPAISQAQTFANPDKYLEGCLGGVEGQTTSGKTGCYTIAAEQWEQEADNAYNLLLGVMDGHQQQALKHDHASWIKYRDEYFKFIQDVFGKKEVSTGGLFIAEEKYKFFKFRTNQLREYYNYYTRLFWTRKN